MILGNVAITAGTGFGNLNDPNYNNVGLLLTGAGGTNGATNNTFLDSSPYGQTVTRNGDVTQGSFTPYLGYYGAYFDGNGDYLSINYSSGSTIAADFTWETWVYDTGANSNGTLLGWRSGSPWQGFIIQRNTNASNLVVNINQSGGLTITQTSNTYLTNQWNHVALVRSGSTVTLYVNGTSAGSGTYSGSFNPGTSYWIGSDPSNNITAVQLQGYISNQRFVNGTAVYTSNFTPSTTPLTAIANTTLLTCQSNRFIDNSPNNFAITRNGNVTVTHFNPFTWNGGPYTTTFNGGSMYFDGSGDYLTAASSPLYAFGTGDFTIEAWVYTTSFTTQRIVSLGTGNNGELLLVNSGSNVWLDWFDGTVDIGSNTTFVTQNAWVHVAVTRSSGTVRVFINGIVSGTPTTSTRSYGTVATYIGTYGGSLNTQNFIGYISNVRIINGTAVYTTAFTPPTQPLQPVYNTVLLLNGTNAGITDRSENTNLVTVADARLSTTQTRYNPTSIFFDGTGDALYSPWNPSLEFGAGNFTIEFWAYVAGGNSLFCWSADFHYGMTFNYGGATSNRVGVWASSNGSTWNIFNADGGGNGISTGTITLNTWTYVTLVRNGSTWTLYLNGTSAWTGTSSATIITRSTDTFRIGGPWPGAGPANLNGYIDDFRITPGVARYTANFTPPTYSPLGF